MKRLLVVRLGDLEPLAAEVLAAQAQLHGVTIRPWDLEEDPVDWEQVLREIFAADSVQAW